MSVPVAADTAGGWYGRRDLLRVEIWNRHQVFHWQGSTACATLGWTQISSVILLCSCNCFYYLLFIFKSFTYINQWWLVSKLEQHQGIVLHS